MYEGICLLAALVRGWWRAGEAVEQGIADLRAAVAAAPEWKHVSYGLSGQTAVNAERQVLAGMLAHVETSRAASPYGRLPIEHY